MTFLPLLRSSRNWLLSCALPQIILKLCQLVIIMINDVQRDLFSTMKEKDSTKIVSVNFNYNFGIVKRFHSKIFPNFVIGVSSRRWVRV